MLMGIKPKDRSPWAYGLERRITHDNFMSRIKHQRWLLITNRHQLQFRISAFGVLHGFADGTADLNAFD